MLAGLLGTAARTSLSAAVMILAVLALRLRFQRQTPQRVFCLLWDIVLVRLLILADIPSPVSIQRLLWPAPAESTAAQIAGTAGSGLVRGVLLQGTAVQAASAPVLPWETLLAAAWIAGALVCAGWMLGGHLRSRRIYAVSLPVRDSFVWEWLARGGLRRPVQPRCSDRISAPLTYGILYPVILLPSGMDLTDRERLSYVLAHEYTHIRRFDVLRKALLAAALCLHWYNPLVWVMYHLACRDMELACDEAVIRSGADRRSYALALLSMEEERGRHPLSGSHFSANALQERIEAIMKNKRVSLTALLAVLVVMSIATTVFAVGAPENPSQDGSRSQDTLVEQDVWVTSGKDGEAFYSADSGITWIPEERYQAQYGGGWGDNWSVTWWTADEYERWLEEEKKSLQEIIGSKAYTGGEGWFVWDQARVDQAVALYESILEDIKRGALYSKEILNKDGNPVEDVSLGSNGPLTASYDSQFQVTISSADAATYPPIDTAALLESFRPFGITGSEQDGLFYNGQPVRCLVDGASVGDSGYAIQYIYTSDTGTVDVHTLRSVIYHADGSYDTMGDLIGMAATGEPRFDQDLIGCALPSASSFQATAVIDSGAAVPGGQTFQELFAAYEPYGLSYTPVDGDSRGSLSYNGQLVGWFLDRKPDGGVFSYENPHGGSLRLHTVYTDGVLTGLAAA